MDLDEMKDNLFTIICIVICGFGLGFGMGIDNGFDTNKEIVEKYKKFADKMDVRNFYLMVETY